ncbi:Lrp/AsnC family transcriptional regulator [Desulfovibrio sp. OttesenSCG-928-C14]|nr:Lrp/AsnC family transcriptional regulator [Desulfovibrio sp. OttesenSCG-928-C14]
MSEHSIKELDGGGISENLEAENALSEAEKKLLGIIQSDFPLVSRPYAVLGERLGVSEEDALGLVLALRGKKIIRRLGANFQSAKIGFKSTLCAAKVPQDKLEAFIAAVNARPGVTHNYLRDHAYNVWFTMIASSWDKVLEELRGIEGETGVPVLNLPAEKLYKIKVDFQMED